MTNNIIEPVAFAAEAPDSRSAPNSDNLAIFGGPRAVTLPYREKWRQIRLRDMIRVFKRMIRDANTQAGGGGSVGDFERRFAKLTQTQYALTMNSGTATLHSAFFAAGVGPGDEVIVPSYTFFASAAPLLQLGAVPVFCDIDPMTLTADPDDVERRITPKTKAICVVHVWGNPARLDRFVEIAKRHQVRLIEDCSHAHGATYQGRPVGSWGDIGCFSLQGSKPVSGGEAGVAVTSDPELYDRMVALGHFGRVGQSPKSNAYDIGHHALGLKFRPHLYAILLAHGPLSQLAELNQRRRRNYDLLRSELEKSENVEAIGKYPDSVRGGFLEFIVRFKNAGRGNWPIETFAKAVAAEGVPVTVDRYKPLHISQLFAQADLSSFGGAVAEAGRAMRERPPSNLPVTMCESRQLVTLPPFTDVSSEFVKQCAQALCKVADAAGTISDLRTGV